MQSIIWLIVLAAAPIWVAYRRVALRQATAILGAVLIAYSIWGGGHWLWLLFLWVLFAGIVALNFPELRREAVSRRLLSAYRRMLPRMSQTEQAALDAQAEASGNEQY